MQVSSIAVKNFLIEILDNAMIPAKHAEFVVDVKKELFSATVSEKSNDQTKRD